MEHPSKFLKVFIVLMIVLLSFAMLSYGHPGRTDSQGGHTNHSTGEYHYHHGHPAHQHPGGVCPYKIAPSGNDDYKDGYSDGYNKGYYAGKSDGYEKGRDERQITKNAAIVSTATSVFGIPAAFAVGKKKKRDGF